MFKYQIKPVLQSVSFIVVLSALVYFCYHPAFSFDFINFDDPVYVTDNHSVKNGITFESLQWAFEIHEDICMYYQPVAWISHMIDVELWGLNPGKHHRTSVVIHWINAVLLFLVLQCMTGSLMKSAISASFFALHPVNVDSVCWIAERKTLVSALFWFLGMGSYLLYTKKPGCFRYVLVAIFFTLGLFTKPVMITFPCVLLLLDIWPLKRLDVVQTFDTNLVLRLVLEKIPLFIITGLWFITPFLSHTLLSNETTTDLVPLGLRISNALVSYVQYSLKFFFPNKLSILYPYPASVPLLQSLASLFILFMMTAVFLFQFRKRPYLIIGWLWFLGVLFPTSGLILGTLWPAMADRWAYIPYVGLGLMISWLVADSPSFFKKTGYLIIPILILFLAVLTLITRHQVNHWKNSETIFNQALTVTGYHYLPHQNMAVELMKKGDHENARKHLRIILTHEPEHDDATYNLGLSFYETGEFKTALEYLLRAIDLNPTKANAYLVASWALRKLNQTSEAMRLCEEALKNIKKKDSILYELSVLLSDSGKKEAAELKTIELLSLSPHHLNGIILYADLLMGRNDKTRALMFYQRALVLDPENQMALKGRAQCLEP